MREGSYDGGNVVGSSVEAGPEGQGDNDCANDQDHGKYQHEREQNRWWPRRLLASRKTPIDGSLHSVGDEEDQEEGGDGASEGDGE